MLAVEQLDRCQVELALLEALRDSVARRVGHNLVGVPGRIAGQEYLGDRALRNRRRSMLPAGLWADKYMVVELRLWLQRP